jgi:hypothetical protein
MASRNRNFARRRVLSGTRSSDRFAANSPRRRAIVEPLAEIILAPFRPIL